MSKLFIPCITLLLLSCIKKEKAPVLTQPIQSSQQIIKKSGQSITSRFNTPNGFIREEKQSTSFAHYLRNLPLKPIHTQVHYYNGAIKPNNNVYEAVIDLPIGNKNLHQCADAVMHLRAEYLWKNKQYNAIHFNFTNGFRVDYSEWMKGRRMVVNGNKTYWNNRNSPSNTYNDFWNYMELVFSYAGTASLEKELQPVAIKNAKIGDVLIQGGFPGHAIIIIDEAVNPTNGKKVFLLAQSYMPAQELQVLTNRNNKKISPWYELQNEEINTPEWNFTSNDLKRFVKE